MEVRAARDDTNLYSTMNLGMPWRGLNVMPQKDFDAADAAAAMYLSSFVYPYIVEAPVHVNVQVGIRLPDWGMRYLIDEIDDQVREARGGGPGSPPPNNRRRRED